MNFLHYKTCIDACLECVVACNHCASMDLKEKHNMAQCIQLNMECAAICTAAAQLMSLGSFLSKEICVLCAEICHNCANECAKHATEHCKACTDACTRCAKLCTEM